MIRYYMFTNTYIVSRRKEIIDVVYFRIYLEELKQKIYIEIAVLDIL